VQNCVALNPSVTLAIAVPNIGRVVGVVSGGTLTNNYAQTSGMTLIYDSGGTPTPYTPVDMANDKDGADITSTNYSSLWATLGFTGTWWSGKLPNLAGYY